MGKTFIIVFTGPSGVGKSEVEKIIFANKKLNLGFSVSATTREPRKGEVHGKNYFFVTTRRFDELVTEGAFFEWNRHFNNNYGTLKSEVTRLCEEGKNPFLEIEVNGAVNVINSLKREEYVSFFLAPPSFEDLKVRIKKRNTESFWQVWKRLRRAKKELAKRPVFDHVIVNDTPANAASQIMHIILERIREQNAR